MPSPRARSRDPRVRKKALERRRGTFYALGVRKTVAVLLGPMDIKRRFFIEREREGRDDTVVPVPEAVCHTGEDKSRGRVSAL